MKLRKTLNAKSFTFNKNKETLWLSIRKNVQFVRLNFMEQQKQSFVGQDVDIKTLEKTKRTPSDMLNGNVFKTKAFGDIEIIEYISSVKVIVRFLSTGFECAASTSNIRSGTVKDKMKPSVFGVGFIGTGKYKVSEDGKLTISYRKWKQMIQRCYSGFGHKSYEDCFVCDEWHNYQIFAEWFSMHYPDDGCDYHLDKDIKFKGNKEYSPETCIFATPKKNMSEGKSAKYSFINSHGVVYSGVNISEFCKDNNLSRHQMYALRSGKIKKHMGWTSA